MREIKFRGKPTENNTSYIEEGAFVYGALIVCDNKYYIALNVNDNINRDDYEVYMIEVIPETVGQYTGLKDKNEEEIYEGDIVAIQFQRATKSKIALIEYSEKYAAFIITHTKEIKHENQNLGDYQMENFEVIGNIYDNPELLGGNNGD